MKNKFMKYCIKCFIPSTKPNAKFDKNGICFACQNYKEIRNLTKKNLHKNTQFEKLFREIKKQKKISLGKINKFKEENSLMTQDWVMEPKKKVKEIISEINIKDLKIKEFMRLKIGD